MNRHFPISNLVRGGLDRAFVGGRWRTSSQVRGGALEPSRPAHRRVVCPSRRPSSAAVLLIDPGSNHAWLLVVAGLRVRHEHGAPLTCTDAARMSTAGGS